MIKKIPTMSGCFSSLIDLLIVNSSSSNYIVVGSQSYRIQLPTIFYHWELITTENWTQKSPSWDIIGIYKIVKNFNSSALIPSITIPISSHNTSSPLMTPFRDPHTYTYSYCTYLCVSLPKFRQYNFVWEQANSNTKCSARTITSQFNRDSVVEIE